jgi:integrase
VVRGLEHQKTFSTAKLAEGYRTRLLVAAREGSAFDVEAGLPPSMLTPAATRTWLDHCVDFTAMKWPHISPHHRRSIAETLAGITVALAGTGGVRPPDKVLRKALYRWAFNAAAHPEDAPLEVEEALEWLTKHSPPLAQLENPQILRKALDSIRVSIDGTPAATSTVLRKRAILHHCLEYAVELEHFPSNPLHRVRQQRMPAPPVVDRRVVVNPDQSRALLASVRESDPDLEAFFACMYFSGLRPAETRNLRQADCSLPERGWGALLLSGSYQSQGPAWTDGGRPGEERQLKHRARGDTRPVPAHPELVAILRRHVAEFPLGPDGRLFVNRHGTSGVPLPPPYPNPVSMSTVYRAWHRARAAAFTAAQVGSPLARRPYDLRHACLSTWLNAGVAPVQVAEWAGHTVAVLLHVYAKCVDGQQEAAMRRIEEALGTGQNPDPTGNGTLKLPHVFPTATRKMPDSAGNGRTHDTAPGVAKPQVRGPILGQSERNTG